MLTHKDVSWEWTENLEPTFKNLKENSIRQNNSCIFRPQYTNRSNSGCQPCRPRSRPNTMRYSYLLLQESTNNSRKLIQPDREGCACSCLGLWTSQSIYLLIPWVHINYRPQTSRENMDQAKTKPSDRTMRTLIWPVEKVCSLLPKLNMWDIYTKGNGTWWNKSATLANKGYMVSDLS